MRFTYFLLSFLIIINNSIAQTTCYKEVYSKFYSGDLEEDKRATIRINVDGSNCTATITL